MRGGFANSTGHNRKGTRIISSAQIDSTGCSAEPGGLQPTSIHRWLSRRRIAISLVGFTSLTLVNVLLVQTVPHNPLRLSSPGSRLGMGLLLTGLVVRTWSAGTLNKSRELTTYGPYALVRNPLYVGSFLMMMGFCVLCRDWPTLLFVAGPMSYLYWKQVRLEEEKLSRFFPAQWSDYVQDTPRFIPRRLKPTCFSGWSWFEWQRNREYKAIAASLLGVVAIWAWYVVRSA